MIIKLFYKVRNNIKPFKTAIFTVIISVTASCCVTLVSDVGKHIISEEMNSLGVNGMSAMAYSSDGENQTGIDFYESILKMKDTVDVSPVIYDTANALFENGISVETMIWGVNDDVSDIITLDTVNGRMITKNDIDSNALVCLVDESLVKTVYKRGNINGKTINISIGDTSAVLKIIGTIKKGSNILNTLTGDVIPNFIYIPYTTMYNLSSKPNFDQIVFTSTDSEQTVYEFKQKLVDDSYRYKNKTIKLTNLSGQKEQINKIVDTAFIALYIVSYVAVVVCSMSVGASVNTAVISRQKDIGIKISMGASRYDITMEFLFAALSACFTGVAIALIFMLVVYIIVKNIIPFEFERDYSLIVLSLFATMILTTIFSLIPSYNASKMPPIKALNRE